nr:uncharacterized protein LOC127325880 [Lolium perenne]
MEVLPVLSWSFVPSLVPWIGAPNHKRSCEVMLAVMLARLHDNGGGLLSHGRDQRSTNPSHASSSPKSPIPSPGSSSPIPGLARRPIPRRSSPSAASAASRRHPVVIARAASPSRPFLPQPHVVVPTPTLAVIAFFVESVRWRGGGSSVCGVLLFDPKHISSGGLGGGGRLQILLGLASSSTSSSTLSMVLARLAIWWWCCLLGGWRRPPLPRPPARGRRPAAAALTRGFAGRPAAISISILPLTDWSEICLYAGLPASHDAVEAHPISWNHHFSFPIFPQIRQPRINQIYRKNVKCDLLCALQDRLLVKH